jgi:hypothetical protein
MTGNIQIQESLKMMKIIHILQVSLDENGDVRMIWMKKG